MINAAQAMLYRVCYAPQLSVELSNMIRITRSQVFFALCALLASSSLMADEKLVDLTVVGSGSDF
ncbi:MAG TPA: hypothetical protein VJN01_01885, partial [Xanthomonadales bacterium]|nr:hypothetical protein [Xanthomonadales bacterium]